MATVDLRCFQADVDKVVLSLKGLSQGTISQCAPEPFLSLLASPGTLSHAKALLPLCDMIGVTWRRSRLPPPGMASGRAAPDCNTVPQPPTVAHTDPAFFMAAAVLPGIFSKYNIVQLLQSDAWSSGERIRLLAPIATLLSYCAHPDGLQALHLDSRKLPDINFTYDDGISATVDQAFVLRVLGAAVQAARRIEAMIQDATLSEGAESNAAGMREIKASFQAGLSAAKNDAAVCELLRALGRATPDVGTVNSRVSIFSYWVTSAHYKDYRKAFSAKGESQGAVPDSSVAFSEDLARLLVSTAASVAQHPDQLRDLDEANKRDAMHLSLLVAQDTFDRDIPSVKEVVMAPDAQDSLRVLARAVRELALATPPEETALAMLWFCTALLGVHPPLSAEEKLRFEDINAIPSPETLEALEETTAAFNFMMSRKESIEPHFIEVLCTFAMSAFMHAAMGQFTKESSHDGDTPPTTETFWVPFLMSGRGDAAACTTILGAVRFLIVAAAHSSSPDFLRNMLLLTIYTPEQGPLPIDDVPFDLASTSVQTVLELLNFALGRHPSPLTPTDVPRATYAWVCSAAFADACVYVRTACLNVDPDNPGEYWRLEWALKAAALKYLRFAAQYSETMEGLFIDGEMAHPTSVPDPNDLIPRVGAVIAIILGEMEGMLAPVLARADAEGLGVLCGLIDSLELEDETAKALRKLEALAAAADPKDKTVALERARTLSALNCAYLGCGNVHIQSNISKKCSACACVSYCTRDCQVADWKAHRVACRAMQSEGGV